MVNRQFVDIVVKEYLDIISGVSLTGREVSEMFRYCICRILNLDTQIAIHLEELSKLVINRLSSLKGWPALRTEEERCAYLEVFVHVMEAVREGASL